MPAWEQNLARRVSACTACERLAEYCAGFRDLTGYWARGVPGFGDPRGRVLVLGLAPGAHGANRTGRPFTGDAAGVLLYRALHACGFASRPESAHRRDGLRLKDAWISNVVRCVPPANKPVAEEVARCAPFLEEELRRLANLRIVVALGRVAHHAILRQLRGGHPALRMEDHAFGHAKVHAPAQGLPLIVDTFHPSRYNVNTGRLTWPMFRRVFTTVRELLEGGVAAHRRGR